MLRSDKKFSIPNSVALRNDQNRPSYKCKGIRQGLGV
jgi:hypothetical protein